MTPKELILLYSWRRNVKAAGRLQIEYQYASKTHSDRFELRYMKGARGHVAMIRIYLQTGFPSNLLKLRH